MTGSLAPNQVAHFVAYLFGGTLQLVLFPEWALKRERRRNRRSGLPTKHLRRLGVVRDENPCQLLHNTMILVLALPMEHHVEVRRPSLGGLLRHAVFVFTQRGGQNRSEYIFPET